MIFPWSWERSKFQWFFKSCGNPVTLETWRHIQHIKSKSLHSTKVSSYLPALQSVFQFHPWVVHFQPQIPGWVFHVRYWGSECAPCNSRLHSSLRPVDSSSPRWSTAPPAGSPGKHKIKFKLFIAITRFTFQDDMCYSLKCIRKLHI